MRFEENIHWAEGLFLQPHHMQGLQKTLENRDRAERAMLIPHPCGLIDFELDQDALANFTVVVKRISAILPSGLEVSMPGNAVIPPLDLTEIVNSHPGEFTVFLAVPQWTEHDANLSSENEPGQEKRLYRVRETLMRDENSGENEITVAKRRINARLVTNLQENADLELLPLMKLAPHAKEASETLLSVNKNYIPPFFAIGLDCPLYHMIYELDTQIRNRRNKLLRDFATSGYKAEMLSGAMAVSMFQLRSLSRGESRISAFLETRKTPPFLMYVELRTLLGELSALQPLRDLDVVPEYNHLDCAPQFFSLFSSIRSLILAEGVSSYVKVAFQSADDGVHLVANLKDEHFVMADEYYLALSCAGDPKTVISAVETGDNFKIVNPSSGFARIRGVKLEEMRYPPRFLPALGDVIWFKLLKENSSRVWREICDEHAMTIDWAHDLFPKLEAVLYITVLTENKTENTK